MSNNHLRMILKPVAAGLLVGILAATPAPAQDVAAAARRVAATVQLAAEEYRLGVSGGRVIARAEVNEAGLFLSEARRNLDRIPEPASTRARAAIDRLDSLVAHLAEPDSVARHAADLVASLGDELHLVLDEIPQSVPSLARGREVYQATCASCHGPSGRGDGPQAAALTPRPANLAEPDSQRGSSPLDFYRRITVGTAGTAMPPYEHALSAEDRWAVALYASVLRLPRPGGDVPAALRSFPTSARMSDSAVLAALGPGADRARLAAVRTFEPEAGHFAAAVFSEVRRQLDSAYDLARAGRAQEARTTAMDAYVTFEQIERKLRVKDPALTAEIEAAFTLLRTRHGGSATPEELSGIHLGVGAAVVMSLLTAAGLETVLVLSPSHQEGLEGGVMLVATATLFYVSYWLLSKMEVSVWKRFVRGKMEAALTRGSALALASVAFLAVYREGFETVLFFQALAASGGPGSGTWAPLGAGIGAGGAVLAVVYVAINRFGVRLPLKPLFAVTGALLYYMAFVFAGKGIAELHEGGAVSLTPLEWAPRVPVMGVYPTAESLAAQAVLVLLALLALIWIFVVEPRQQVAGSR